MPDEGRQPKDPTLQAALDQIDVWWGWFRWRIEGLSDDEYLWEPAPGCWTVRQREDGRWLADPWPGHSWQGGLEGPPRFTTIAWRLVHLTYCPLSRLPYFEPDLAAIADWGTQHPDVIKGTAREAVDAFNHWWGRWRDRIAALTPEEVHRPLGGDEQVPDMKLGAEDPFINVVLHINRETIHHGAEVALLRDLYRAAGR